MHVHLSPVSMNAKTGPIPVSTSTKAWCPDSCSLKGNGCYAEAGNLAIHWKRVTNGERGMAWDEFCDAIQDLNGSVLWRHNQAGDLPGDGQTIDEAMLAKLVFANKGKRGFTFTHYSMDSDTNRRAVHTANALGFTINLSAESLTEADKLKAIGVAPVATMVEPTDQKSFKTPAGNRVVVCPATYRAKTTCATCQLCQRQRDVIVGFPIHGTSKKKAHKVFILKSA